MARRYLRSGSVPNAPSNTIWIVALVIGLLGLLGRLVFIDVITPNSFVLVAIGFILLVIGTTMRRI